ncbi:MAG: hypothetical protein M1514_00975 [Patescibacteria group bacterium]|nr:hypothetical protein [Patescibacteria group bacterium]
MVFGFERLSQGISREQEKEKFARGYRLSSYQAEAEAVLEILRNYGSSPENPGLIKLQTTPPGPDGLQVYATRPMDKNSLPNLHQIFVCIVQGLSPYVDVIFLKGEEVTTPNETGTLKVETKRGETSYPFRDAKVIDAYRLATEKGNKGVFLTHDAAWARVEELKAIYDFGAEASEITFSSSSLTLSKKWRKEKNFFDKLEAAIRRPVSQSIEHAESRSVIESIIQACGDQRALCEMGNGRNSGSVEIWAGVNQGRQTVRIDALHIIGPNHVDYVSLKGKARLGAAVGWEQIGNSNFYYDPQTLNWAASWIMSHNKGRGPSPSNQWLSVGQARLQFEATRLAFDLNISVSYLIVPNLPPLPNHR